jgi:hypothetical protein
LRAGVGAFVGQHGLLIPWDHHLSHGLLAVIGGMLSNLSLHFHVFMFILSSDTCIALMICRIELCATVCVEISLGQTGTTATPLGTISIGSLRIE